MYIAAIIFIIINYIVCIAAQFWNIPISSVVVNNVTYVQVFDDGHPSYRLIPAERQPRTWGHMKAPCYYVGNNQGGPSGSHNPRQSVIEGRVSQYETPSLFSPSFFYARFDESLCVAGAA